MVPHGTVLDITRYHFGEFVLSPRQRVLWRAGAPVAIIPKYFDLLHLLIRRRHEAVAKHAIFTEVWRDVIVSDGALSQAIRILRRTLDDDAREPRFIRTVARHGYQFVWADLREEPDHGPPELRHVAAEADQTPAGPSDAPAPDHQDAPTPDQLIDQLLRLAAAGPSSRDEARDIAERLHAVGTADAVARLTARPHHARALALMRDSRWSVPGAGPVPLASSAAGAAAALALAGMRLSDMRRTVRGRWSSAGAAGAMGGALAGVCGGVALLLAPAANTRPEAIVALSAVGFAAGGLGAAGIGAGITVAETLARSRRALALAVCGGLSGALVGGLAYGVLRALLTTFAGSGPWPLGGPLEGLVIGAAAGASYAFATPQPAGGGVAAPSGTRRLAVLALVGLGCAAGAIAIGWLGRPLVGGHLNALAQSSRDGQLLLSPIGRLIGEPGFGPITQRLLGAFEGGVFGVALAWGLTRRPAPGLDAIT